MRPTLVRQLPYNLAQPAPVLRLRLLGLALSLAVAASACSSAKLPSIASGAGQIETSAAGSSDPGSGPYETATTAPGDPTTVYTQVARAIHACWFGAGGPLTNTHVFRAEAQSPTKGGQAEIIIHERDVAFTDQRGPQALRISFENAAGVSRVGVKVLKLPPGYGEPITRDVEVWAKGGVGCQLRASFPQPSATTAEKLPGKPGTKPGAKSTR
jgi:hypothetical protein